MEECGAKAPVLRLAHGRPAVLAPLQMELPGTLSLTHTPLNPDISRWNRKSPVPDRIRGEFVRRHADRNRQISRKLQRWSEEHEARLPALGKRL